MLSRSAMATPPPGGVEKSTVVPSTPDTSVLPTAAGLAAPFFVTTPVGQSKSTSSQSLLEVSGLAKASDGITPAVGSTLLQQQGVAPASAHNEAFPLFWGPPSGVRSGGGSDAHTLRIRSKPAAGRARVRAKVWAWCASRGRAGACKRYRPGVRSLGGLPRVGTGTWRPSHACTTTTARAVSSTSAKGAARRARALIRPLRHSALARLARHRRAFGSRLELDLPPRNHQLRRRNPYATRLYARVGRPIRLRRQNLVSRRLLHRAPLRRGTDIGRARAPAAERDSEVKDGLSRLQVVSRAGRTWHRPPSSPPAAPLPRPRPP